MFDLPCSSNIHERMKRSDMMYAYLLIWILYFPGSLHAGRVQRSEYILTSMSLSR